MKYSSHEGLGLLLMSCILCGCSAGKTYREIDPAAAAEDERQSNGYYSLKSVSPGTTKLVIRSSGMPGTVSVFTTTSDIPCKDFKPLGNVIDTGHGVLYPWIAKFSEKLTLSKTFVETEIEPNKTIQIRGYGAWASDGRPGSTSGHCGPITSVFTPLANRAYLLQFLWLGTRCQQVISDATDPDAPVSVVAKNTDCPWP